MAIVDLDLLEHRLDADKTEGRRCRAEMLDASVPSVFDSRRRRQPDVRKRIRHRLKKFIERPRLAAWVIGDVGHVPCADPTIGEIFPHTFGALRQDLECMSSRERHDGKDPIDRGVRQVLMEEVRHRVDEDAPRPRPAERLCERALVEPHRPRPHRSALR